VEAVRRLGVPLRDDDHAIRYSGEFFYAQSRRGEAWPEGISVQHLVGFLAMLPEGVTELGCESASDGLCVSSVPDSEVAGARRVLGEERTR